MHIDAIKYKEKEGSSYHESRVMVTCGWKKRVIRKGSMGDCWGVSDMLFLNLDDGAFIHSLITLDCKERFITGIQP